MVLLSFSSGGRGELKNACVNHHLVDSLDNVILSSNVTNDGVEERRPVFVVAMSVEKLGHMTLER